MHDTDDNPWKTKAIALDHFRWALLRERHGLFGSTLRFVRDALLDTWFGLHAKCRLATAIETESCDYLLLQASPKVIGLKRKKLLINALLERGNRLVETALQEPRDLCANRLLARPPYPTPLRYYGYAAHATWIIERYQPRVLLNDRNGSLFSPFLRLSLANRKCTLVHLAHATTVESSRRLSMNDYDYYLLFGPSSLQALKTRALRFGTSTVLLTGSHMIDKSFDLPPANQQARTLLVLGVGPDKEKEAGYQRTYELLSEWAREHPEYHVLVKRHPRSSVPFWQEAGQTLKNINVLPSDRSLAQALEQASLVVNIMSNAVIEAGLAARPVIYCNLSDDRDIFNQEQFFGAAATTPTEFHSRVQAIENDFSAHVQQSRAFALFHLAHGSQGLDITQRTLEALLTHSELPKDVEQHVLPETAI